MGCCFSTSQEEADGDPYDSSRAGDNSSRANHRGSSHALEQAQSQPSPISPASPRSNHTVRRRPAPNEQLNAPLRPHTWTSKQRWTRTKLEKERREFFETRVTGHTEIWASLRTVVELLGQGDIETAQSILDAAAITVPTGDLKNGVYDEAGNLYSMPDHIISDPQNVVVDAHEDEAADLRKGELSADATDDETELKIRRDEKGKSVISEVDAIRVKARLSDRGGPDIVIKLSKDQAVRVLIRRVQEEAHMNGKGKVRIAYMGKILKENESLQTQGWCEGHVVNALVSS